MRCLKLLPSKIISVADSLIWKLPYIIDIVKKGDIAVEELFTSLIHRFEDVSEFILCLDALYLLDRIELDDNNEVIKYVN